MTLLFSFQLPEDIFPWHATGGRERGATLLYCGWKYQQGPVAIKWTGLDGLVDGQRTEEEESFKLRTAMEKEDHWQRAKEHLARRRYITHTQNENESIPSQGCPFSGTVTWIIKWVRRGFALSWKCVFNDASCHDTDSQTNNQIKPFPTAAKNIQPGTQPHSGHETQSSVHWTKND